MSSMSSFFLPLTFFFRPISGFIFFFFFVFSIGGVGNRIGEGGISGELSGGVADSDLDGERIGAGAGGDGIGDGDWTGRAIFCPRSKVDTLRPATGGAVSI